jgi:hypothetical protein
MAVCVDYFAFVDDDALWRFVPNLCFCGYEVRDLSEGNQIEHPTGYVGFLKELAAFKTAQDHGRNGTACTVFEYQLRANLRRR